jgi:hypothetical protein
MARISEILAERKNKGFGIPERVAEVTGSAPGITEELYTNAVLDSLGGSYPWLTARLEKAEKPSIPSYKSILNLLDIEDEEGGRTALQQFVEDFPEKRAEWKKKALKKDSTLGEKGWKTIYDIWKQVSVDKMNSDIKIELSAHTDDVGADAYNFKLSDQRAAAVAEYLIAKGIAKSRIISKGYGKTQPLVPNTSDENRAKNRRVELKVISTDNQ